LTLFEQQNTNLFKLTLPFLLGGVAVSLLTIGLSPP
jgi:hypothetical protein